MISQWYIEGPIRRYWCKECAKFEIKLITTTFLGVNMMTMDCRLKCISCRREIYVKKYYDYSLHESIIIYLVKEAETRIEDIILRSTEYIQKQLVTKYRT